MVKIPKRFTRAHLFTRSGGWWFRPVRGVEVFFCFGPYVDRQCAERAAKRRGLRPFIQPESVP